jgi:dihydrofolate reductase
MKKPKISIIAAIGENSELGYNNQLLWRIPGDLKFFNQKTKNHVVIMGRNTFESIGKPLPDRVNIVLSRDLNLEISDCLVADSFEKALELAEEREKEEIFIIGGAKVYTEALAVADKLYLTLVKGKYQADVFFPKYENFKMVQESQEHNYQDYKFRFTEWRPK